MASSNCFTNNSNDEKKNDKLNKLYEKNIHTIW